MFAALMRWLKSRRLLPQISPTEKLALEAGTVWIDGQIFGGKPDFRSILAQPYRRLPPEEQAFLDGPVEQLCRMTDHYAIERSRRMPAELLAFIKQSGMMGLLVPKEYGGKDFSALGISSVLAKLGPVSSTVSTFVLIPNSLGAAELIRHYGTAQQKSHYLPRLASGEYVPCFGLTEPTAGSDAASIKAEALVFKDGDGALKLRLNFRKRYITLAPAADLATIACHLRDPQNLLGKGEDPGITCVLVHKGTPGFTSGDHHDPIGSPFYNGPLIGKDLVVPVDNIVGGAAGAGEGWRMLMEQLAGGRMISLPAGAAGGARAVAAVTGAYSMVRQQFGIPIGRMEGVQEKVGRIAALTYLLEGARVFGCSAVDAGHKPPVTSAVLKAYSTELARELVIAGMDVFAGAGIMQGPNNLLGMGYKSAPVGVTVEGANIMTRTLIVFGQGATRCHPYALKLVQALERDDVRAFRRNLLGWIGHFAVNLLRSAARWCSRGYSAGSPVRGATARYYRRLGWSATRFAVLADLAMFSIGGKLKQRGQLAGRYADALAWQILALCALRRWEAEGRKQEDLPLVQYGCEYALHQIQEAFAGIHANFDGGLPGLWLRSVGSLALRLNPVGRPPADRLAQRAAATIQSPSEQYRRIVGDSFLPQDDSRGAGRLLKAFRLLAEAGPVLDQIRAAQKAGRLRRGNAEELAQDAANLGLIDGDAASLVRRAQAARLEAIEVDVFTPEQYFASAREDGSEEPGEAPARRAAAG